LAVSLARRSLSDFDSTGVEEDEDEEVDVEVAVVVVGPLVFLDRLEAAFVTVAFIVRDCVVVEDGAG